MSLYTPQPCPANVSALRHRHNDSTFPGGVGLMSVQLGRQSVSVRHCVTCIGWSPEMAGQLDPEFPWLPAPSWAVPAWLPAKGAEKPGLLCLAPGREVRSLGSWPPLPEGNGEARSPGGSWTPHAELHLPPLTAFLQSAEVLVGRRLLWWL